ncbi:flagellar export chaperone FliS [Cellvibrio japonicus]|uniref:Flagellar secretion chaperone FliS n=1 Tax=Cellvibrio japonicus (strain Ueda107) TaxID=498211 RepID=B3PEX5_CELJU|nr:flagellar export chaperone FliS [Cellvibrio japonicus]ACE85648.1 flagellar protein FliS [Cellvibrio japonicus Ueda107]QEI12222.1 flagellar export chaperone FliS [Cellvibrio japonicus]QEI15796.1 flagellar export chaperone FliS [Cellvibrio japonicus]QEI19374.1 flagellar export chaperone FliS [Cellvibrio japonicus]
MNSFSAIQHYASVKVHSGVDAASPHRLIQMLFEGALERIAQAKGAMQQNQLARKGELLGKAINIVGGLQGSLNDREGGDLAANLDSLYDYVIRRLTQANYENNPDYLDECTGLLSEIKAGWDAIGTASTVQATQS